MCLQILIKNNHLANTCIHSPKSNKTDNPIRSCNSESDKHKNGEGEDEGDSSTEAKPTRIGSLIAN
jgi:hypothetical protein